MNRGKFIVFEGLDGCGKDTQIKLLKTELENQGKEVVITSNIDNGPFKNLCRDMLKPESEDFIDSFHLSIVILTNMAITYKKIRSDLDEGKYVLCSRWYLSSLAYGGRKNDLEFNIIKNVIDGFNLDPDLFIFLDTCPEVAIDRITKRGDRQERYDTIDKLREIDNCYIKAMLCKTNLNIVKISADQPIEDVFQKVWSFVTETVV